MEKLIAKDLLKIKAVFFRPDEPFTWASGIKSPVYCDNRLILTAPEVRNDVENGLATLIKENYPDVYCTRSNRRTSYGFTYGLCSFRRKRPRPSEPD